MLLLAWPPKGFVAGEECPGIGENNPSGKSSPPPKAIPSPRLMLPSPLPSSRPARMSVKNDDAAIVMAGDDSTDPTAAAAAAARSFGEEEME